MNRPRDRVSAAGLLPRMESRPWADGKTVTYRYHPVGKRPIALGTDKSTAIRKVLDLNGQRDTYGTLEWVWEKYQETRRWLKLADGTRADYALAWKQLCKVLGQLPVNRIDAPMVARYVNVERAAAPRRAVIEKALLSNLCRHAITLGLCNTNPTIGVEVPEAEPRTEAPDGAVLAGFLAWLEQQTPQRRIVGMAAEYASLAGSRRVEFLDLAWPQVDRDTGVIRVKRAKQRGKKRGEVVDVIEISNALGRLLDRLTVLREQRGADCLYVFPTRDNNAYSARGFKTLWQRCVIDAIEAKALNAGARFTFHDLRAYYATVHKRTTGSLPDMHANPGVTARVYDRNKEVKRRSL